MGRAICDTLGESVTATGLIPPHASAIDWRNPLTRDLVGCYPGVQVVNIARPRLDIGVLASAGPVRSNCLGPAWCHVGTGLAEVAPNPDYDFDRFQPWTVSLQFVAVGGARMDLLCRMSAAARGWALRLLPSGNSDLWICSSATSYSRAVTDSPVVTGGVQRAVISYDGTGDATGAKFLVDGKRYSAEYVIGSLSGTTSDPSTPLTVGLDPNWFGDGLTGYTRDTVIWRRALSVAEAVSFSRDPGQIVMRDSGCPWLVAPPPGPGSPSLAPVGSALAADRMASFVADDGVNLSAFAVGDGSLIVGMG